MDAERLKQIENMYHAALEIPSNERDSFFNEHCGEDKELRSEVESLLKFRKSSDDFLDSSPESLAAEMFSGQEKPDDLIDKEITHYKINNLIGKGGMGEVYLARDLRLDRNVALKFLSAEVTGNADRLKRFEREAYTASGLNHPNILTIYEFGEENGFHFIATEYVEGESLRHAIKTGNLSLLDSLRIAEQIAFALSATHEANIVHRDIKPDNIMIRRDEIVKILDFGLAKLSALQTGIEAEKKVLIETNPGMVMGTVSYMSPEQARGNETDARTDLWSLGVVLFEMLTGRLPFAGESMTDSIAEILKNDAPPISQYLENVPTQLETIVQKSLAKNRDERYQTARDFMIDLKKLRRELDLRNEIERSNPPMTSRTAGGSTVENLPTQITDEGEAANSADNRISTKGAAHPVLHVNSVIPKNPTRFFLSKLTNSSIFKFLLIGLFSILAAGIFFVFYNRVSVVPLNSETSFANTKLDRVTASGLIVTTAISPDGRYIAFAKNEAGKESLWLRQTASTGDTPIVAPDKTKYDFLKFSPDGNFIYFVGETGDDQPPALYQISTLGRNQRKLSSNVDSQISFSPDGRNIAFIRASDGNNSIIIVNEQGKNERVLTTRKHPEVYGDEVSWSPDGKLIAVPTLTRGATYAAGIAVVNVATGSETPIRLNAEKLLRISRIAWLNEGKGLIYSLYAADMGQRYQLRYVDIASGEVQNVTNDLSSYEDFSLTADFKTMVVTQREYSMGIWLTPADDFSNAVTIDSKIGADDGERGVSWTKEGKIVFVTSEGSAQNIWRMDADGSNKKPLTVGYDTGKLLPAVSVGGDLITYLTPVKPGLSFFQMDTEGQNVRRVVADSDCAFAAASANENWVVYTSSAGGKLRIWKAPLNGGDAVQLSDVESIAPVISRNGKSVAYFIREKGKPLALGIISIDGGNPLKSFPLPETTNTKPGLAWNKNGDGILFVDTFGTTSNIWTQPLDGSAPKPLTNFKEFQIAAFALNADGNRLAVARGSRNRDIVLIKNIRY